MDSSSFQSWDKYIGSISLNEYMYVMYYIQLKRFIFSQFDINELIMILKVISMTLSTLYPMQKIRHV